MLKDRPGPPIWRAFPKDDSGWILSKEDETEPKRLEKRLADILKLYDTPKTDFSQNPTQEEQQYELLFRIQFFNHLIKHFIPVSPVQFAK